MMKSKIYWMTTLHRCIANTLNQNITTIQTAMATTTDMIADNYMETETMEEIKTKTDKAIIIDERLLTSPLSNSFYHLLLKNHDVYSYHMDFKADPDQSARKIHNKIFDVFQKGYNNVSFIGYRESCELFYSLYRLKGFYFDSVVLLNGTVDSEIFNNIKDKTKHILCINQTYKADKLIKKDSYTLQEIKTFIPFTHSTRVAKEVFGWLTYGLYESTYLDDP